MSNIISFYGCAPDPLIYYLKALGILRLVAEQLDQQVRGAWIGDTFVLETSRTKTELINFFLNHYSPTPIVAPWNGSSGFYPSDKKQQAMIETLCGSESSRFNSFRNTVEAARKIVGDRTQQPKDDEKLEMLRWARRMFPEAAIEWLDAAYVLGQDKPDYLPLLGSGGNDGRLDFTVNFIARLLSVLPDFFNSDRRSQEKIKQSTAQLNVALLAEDVAQMEKAAVGQFHPAGVGGANASQGVSGDSFVNPWDFILAIEGCLLLASATVRQLVAGSRTRASFPFTARNSNVGYGTATDGEKIRAEIWLPLWSRMAAYREVAHIFREGRVQFNNQKKAVRTGFDFARAVAELGVDRGIDSFQRYAFIERNGQANLATPLGRFEVRERPLAGLIHNIDRWLSLFSRAVGGDKTPPRLLKTHKRIEDSIFRLCESTSKSESADRLREVLTTLGAAEVELANGQKFRADRPFLSPLSDLWLKWVSDCDDSSEEFKIATALASICGADGSASIRENIEPVVVSAKLTTWKENSVHAVWGLGSLDDNLAAVLHRRSIDARARGLSHPVLTSRRIATLEDINAFLNYETDDSKLEDLLHGLVLVNWLRDEPEFAPKIQMRKALARLPRIYTLLKLLFLPEGKFKRNAKSEEIIIKHEPSIVPLLRAGRVADALQVAYQRLQASGLTPASKEFHHSDVLGTRLAAALLIPIDEPSIQFIAALVLREQKENQ